MGTVELGVVILWGLYSLTAFFLGYKQVVRKNNPYGLCRKFGLIGVFVWADAVVFGAFFALVSLVSYLLSDFILFLLIISLFWVVRSIGEQMYWFLEQFAVHHRNPERTIWISKYFKRDSSWIALQIIWQCVSVVSIIATVYLFSVWL